jgi:WD40 repeat protein
VWEVGSPSPGPPFADETRLVLAVAFSPDGRRLASGGYDETVHLWAAPTGQEVATLRGHGEAVTTIAFSPDGQRVASGGEDRTVRVWASAQGTLLKTLRHREALRGVRFTPDGSRVMGVSVSGELRVWEWETGVADPRESVGREDKGFLDERPMDVGQVEWGKSIGALGKGTRAFVKAKEIAMKESIDLHQADLRELEPDEEVIRADRPAPSRMARKGIPSALFGNLRTLSPSPGSWALGAPPETSPLEPRSGEAAF